MPDSRPTSHRAHTDLCSDSCAAIRAQIHAHGIHAEINSHKFTHQIMRHNSRAQIQAPIHAHEPTARNSCATHARGIHAQINVQKFTHKIACTNSRRGITRTKNHAQISCAETHAQIYAPPHHAAIHARSPPLGEFFALPRAPCCVSLLPVVGVTRVPARATFVFNLFPVGPCRPRPPLCRPGGLQD